MKQINQKLFSKLIAFVLVMIGGFCVLLSAGSNPFPKGSFRVFNIAVIGNDVIDGKPIGKDNKSVLDNLCGIGIKLEEFRGFEVLSDSEIILDNQKIPRASVLVGRNIFCFYDMANIYSFDKIWECPYAICPYVLNTKQSHDDWTNRMIRLRDFVKTKNEMCDLRFLGIIDEECSEEVDTYTTVAQQIACSKLDNCKYQQTINTNWILISNMKADIENLISSFVDWDRETEFKQCMHKSFPQIISNEGMNPVFSQHKQFISNPESPVSRAQESSSVCEEAIISKNSFSQRQPKMSIAKKDYDTVACGIYRDHLLPHSDGTIPHGFQAFKKIIVELYRKIPKDKKRKIIDGFSSIALKDSCLHMTVIIGNEIGGGSSKIVPDSDILSIYNEIFVHDKIRKSFEKTFKICLEKGYTPERIVQALNTLEMLGLEANLWKGCYHDIKSSEI